MLDEFFANVRQQLQKTSLSCYAYVRILGTDQKKKMGSLVLCWWFRKPHRVTWTSFLLLLVVFWFFFSFFFLGGVRQLNTRRRLHRSTSSSSRGVSPFGIKKKRIYLEIDNIEEQRVDLDYRTRGRPRSDEHVEPIKLHTRLYWHFLNWKNANPSWEKKKINK